MENPTCKGVIADKCAWVGCSKCHDETTWNCDTCCDACVKTKDSVKGVTYCAPRKGMELEMSEVEEA